MTDVTKEGAKEFSFKVNGAKYIFSTESTEQQASWIVALEKKVEEAKASKEDITGSEDYKSSLEKYSMFTFRQIFVAVLAEKVYCFRETHPLTHD